MPYLRINGYDITRRIEQGGFKLSENDLDSPNSGRTLDAVMQRGKVSEKNKAEIKLIPTKKAYLETVLPKLRNQYVTVETDFFPGKGPLVMEMYCSSRSYGVPIIDTSGEIWYQDVSFNIIER